jgi:hypothetical protein
MAIRPRIAVVALMVNLRNKYLAIEVVEFFIEDANEPDIFIPGVL